MCAHTHTHTYTRAHTHTHTHTLTTSITLSFFFLCLYLAQICTHGTNSSACQSDGASHSDVKDATRLLPSKKMVSSQNVKDKWTLSAEQTEELFEKLLTGTKWASGDIWVRADKSEFRLKTKNAEFQKPRTQYRMTRKLESFEKSRIYHR